MGLSKIHSGFFIVRAGSQSSEQYGYSSATADYRSSNCASEQLSSHGNLAKITIKPSQCRSRLMARTANNLGGLYQNTLTTRNIYASHKEIKFILKIFNYSRV